MMFEEPRELEEFEELSEEDIHPKNGEGVDFNLLSVPCVQVWRASYENCSVPFAILDNKLRIIWANGSYNETIGRGRDLVGDYFTRIFYLDKNQPQIDSMYKNIFLPENGYSWKGSLETGSREHLTLIVNTLIFPILDHKDAQNHQTGEDRTPAGFGVVIDDITDERKKLVRGTFSSLLEASKLKDNDTGRHIQRVNEYSKTLAKAVFKDPSFPEVDMEFIENISFLAAMHDVGKIGTPDDILNKQGPLDQREWKIMQEHTINGAYILSTYPAPIAKEIALFHHEKWDGSGYPYKLSQDLIPLSARIVAVADVYDALRMKRSYKDPFSHEEARNIMIKNSSTHFDPRLIEYFTGDEAAFKSIYLELADD